MIVLNQSFTNLTVTPKSFSFLKSLYKSMQTLGKWLYQDVACDKPKGLPYSNREWNRNSAFIMSRYELDHEDAVSGRVND